MKKRMLLFIAFLSVMVAAAAYSETLSFSNNPDAIEKAALSVLKLSIFDASNQLVATGSGFVMFDNMTVVTNYHVIENAASIVAESDEGYQYFLTKVKTADKEKDIAILSFMTPTVMKPLEYSLTKMKRGETVTAIGSPKGLKNSVSVGNVSAVFNENDEDWLQITAPISPGSSGGALFNNEGRIIGITSATRSDGQNINFAISISEAVTLYQKWDGKEKALTGFFNNSLSAVEYAEDYFKQGTKYYRGDGIEQDYKRAVELFNKAIDKGDFRAYGALGICYLYGRGVERDAITAVHFIKIAADNGISNSMTILGFLYEKGEGIEQNNQLMIQWYQKAADLGDPAGMYHLGRCYKNGKGVIQNNDRMVSLFKKAAESGSTDAMIELAWCYANGRGVKKSKDNMLEWLKNAAEAGDEYAAGVYNYYSHNR